MKRFSKYNVSSREKSFKKAVLVTLADKAFVKAARQFFTSAFYNANWQGDCLLLAHNIPTAELKWFRERGIIIKQCKSVYQQRIADTPPVILDKFYLFTLFFKRWEIVIFYDADVIVRSSLDGLLAINKFAAVNNCNNDKLKMEIIKKEQIELRGLKEKSYRKILSNLEQEYDLEKIGFGAGMLVFSTKIINRKVFGDLKSLVEKYAIISRNADQLTLNLFFYKQWQALPPVYDLYILLNKNQWKIPLANIKAIALHFPGPIKPWHKESYFCKEWEDNYRKSEIPGITQMPADKWSRSRIILSSFYLNYRYKRVVLSKKISRPFLKILYSTIDGINRIYFYILHKVEKYFPKIFNKLKFAKKKIKKYFYEKTITGYFSR